ncbi:tryptophan 7-halogenase [Trichocoleus sp. FACHB-90]|uniref:NAD(P)/FAD-dependent oxidoreductase n=1 Tax=Cyanophyceae TaxID=3028117 RepID=UPI001687611D|nr:tryptophan 7-halogenase [Trichocoleus sp. FACHB-90]MBD1929964.1 tryptophan 7-halogenase [Trichocoleus sp. FACHB-90]
MISQQVYDVVIIGAGFAGNCQARHLLLNIPNIRIAIVDPRPVVRSEKDLKVGESTVEISAMFLYKELGLHEYLIENHPPKHGLNFHWPKNPQITKSTDDYYHVWTNRPPLLPSFQINRAKLEQDLLRMNREAGATFYNGRVIDVDLSPKDELKPVWIKLEEQKIEIRAKHIIDAAGRRFLIGRKTNNLIFEPEHLYGINTGSAWIRVKGVNPKIFHSGYDPLNGTASHYYGTNHWFGYGHWVWMIPIDSNEMELSIGLVHHHNIIESKKVNTQDKLLGFLKANHTVIYNLINSGECVDFNYLPRLAHTSKTMFSEDNWYVIGEAANMFDPFYSSGLVLTAIAVESITGIIAAKLANDPKAEQMRTLYNEFNLTYAQVYNRVYQYHEKHLGHAGVMSWRIYLENMFWFGVVIPMYVGKWHLDLDFAKQMVKIAELLVINPNGVYSDFYKQFSEIVESNRHIGFIDMARADQLFKGYVPTKFFDSFLENTKFEPRHCNVFAGAKSTFFFAALLYAKLRLRGFGILGVLAPKTLFRFVQLLAWSVGVAIAEQIYLFKMKNVPNNSLSAAVKQEFDATYRYQPKLQPWEAEQTSTLQDQEVRRQAVEVYDANEFDASPASVRV